VDSPYVLLIIFSTIKVICLSYFHLYSQIAYICIVYRYTHIFLLPIYDHLSFIIESWFPNELLIFRTSLGYYYLFYETIIIMMI
jgi:hypothetical protein